MDTADITKEYALMCEKATELQSKWNFRGRYFGDFFSNKNKIIGVLSAGTFLHQDEDYYWIPRADQLLTMVNGDFIETCDYISHYTEKFVELKTPEKILITIVMEENYNKKWNGEDWVKC